ncbi:MAG: hypothetical protein FWF84_01075 [Kiritimatiellaeota bacterium]|nr:hypothetical protein [Kiritimatiellota bacterium]
MSRRWSRMCGARGRAPSRRKLHTWRASVLASRTTDGRGVASSVVASSKLIVIRRSLIDSRAAQPNKRLEGERPREPHHRLAQSTPPNALYNSAL